MVARRGSTPGDHAGLRGHKASREPKPALLATTRQMARLDRRRLAWVALGALSGACTGSIRGDEDPAPPAGGGAGMPVAPSGGGPGGGGSGGPASPVGGGAGDAMPGTTGEPGPAGGAPAARPPSGNDLLPEDLACRGGDAPATPARLWRLGAAEWTATVAVALAGVRPPGPNAALNVPRELSVAPFTYRSSDPFTTFSAGYAMTEGEFEEAANAAAVAARLIVNALKPRSPCITGAADAAALRACLAPLVAARGEHLFRRPLTQDEVARYGEVAATNLGKVEGGSEGATVLAFEAMLLAPQFLHRVEVGSRTGPEASRLTPYEIASALSYTLTRRPPDAPLWEAARSGQLATGAQIRAQVERLMTARLDKLPTEHYETGRHGDYAELRFVRELFRYEAQPVKSTSVIHPNGYMPDRALWDATETVKLVFKDHARKDFWKQLLTTRTFVARAQTAKYFGPSALGQMRADINTQFNQTVTFPAHERAGLMTTPAFLSAFSSFDHNLPVQRGRFIREALLCLRVPELPIGQVPPLPELGERARMRDRLQVHSSIPACAGCHRVMDPMGLPFEQYDHVGLLRGATRSHYTVGLVDERGPIDVTGALVGAGPVDGPVAGGAPELMDRLARSPVVEQCFVRQSFRYWLGREETANDACTLASAHEAYTRSGGDLVALVAALLASPANLVRATR